MNGEEVGGEQLAQLVSKMVEALNSRDIPTAGSILEHFNRELVTRVRDTFAAALDAIALPVREEKLDTAASQAYEEAIGRCMLPLAQGGVLAHVMTSMLRLRWQAHAGGIHGEVFE